MNWSVLLMFEIDSDFLYNVIDDYQAAESDQEREEIFNDFCNKIWTCENQGRKYQREIKFTIQKQLLETEIGKIFNAWSVIPYMYFRATYKSRHEKYYIYIRQKINNLYFKYFDPDIVIDSHYFNFLKTPKNLYFNWIQHPELTKEEITKRIDEAMDKAVTYKKNIRARKIDMPFSEYKELINGYLKKCLENYDADYEKTHISQCKRKKSDGLENFDNPIVYYFCNSIEGYIINYQKEYFGLPRNKKYGVCKNCGKLFVKNDYRKLLCSDCEIHEGYNPYYHYEPILTKKITCCDCGKEFEVNGISKNVKRCPECQCNFIKAYDRARKRVKK